MTKAEELKLLAQIDALIKSADPCDYIPMTFAGIVEVCKRNIEDDFGNIPVQDAEDARTMLHAEERRHDETKRQLAEAQKIAKDAMDQRDKLLAERDEWEQNAHDAGDLYCELEEECRAKSQEITRLRAEIMRMKFERMTEVDLATMYEKMEGAN